jgi:uncharacterized protein YjdB
MKSTTINRSYKKQLAELFGKTEDYVAKVLNGKRHNKAITDAYNLLCESESKTIEILQTNNCNA